MTHCVHDGAPLMSTAYSPPGNQAAQRMPQSAPWQNYPSKGYSPQHYPPQAGWQAGLTDKGKSGQSNTKKIVIYSVVLGVIAIGFILFFILR
jgi:hypothetical protein